MNQPVRLIAAPYTPFGVDGDVAYNVGANGMATRAADAVAKDRRAEIYHHPITIVRAALDPAAKLTNPRTQDNQSIVDITTANGLAFTLAIDSGTKLPSRVVSMTDNTNLGDVAVETTFADYQDVNGLKMPATFTTSRHSGNSVAIRAFSSAGPPAVGSRPEARSFAFTSSFTNIFLKAVTSFSPTSGGVLVGTRHIT